jgi:O-antigen/teichoic acid export membrane protein
MMAFGLAAAGAALSVGSYSLTAGAQGLQGSIGPGAMYTATQVISIVFTVGLLERGWGVVALGAANFVRGFGLFVGSMGYLLWRTRRERIVCRASWDVFREVLGLSGFTFLAKIPGTLAQQMDTLVVARFLGPQTAVIYGLTRRGYDVARLIAERPIMALMPAIAHLAGEGDLTRLKATLLRVARMTLWLAGLLVAGFLAFNSDFLRLWVGSEFFAGLHVNALLALGMGLVVLVTACSNLGFALGDVRGNSIATLATSLLSIGLLWLGARFGGLTGIAAAPLAGSLFVGMVYFPRALACRLHLVAMDWNELMREGLLTSGIATGCALIFGRMQPLGWISFAAWTVACALSFGVGLLVFSKAAKNEVGALSRHFGLNKRKQRKAEMA